MTQEQRLGEAASYYSEAAAHQQQQQHHRPGPDNGSQSDGPTGERGFLGAVGGGLAGGLGGHKIGDKTGHSKLGTVLGVVAGAVAGHKLQDGVSDWKDKRDEKKEEKKKEEERRRREEEERRRKEEEERRRQKEQQHHGNSGSSQTPHHDTQSRGGVNYAGNFSSSSRDIRLDAHGEYMLHASCRRLDGSYQHSSISLNQIIENDDGKFRWASGRGNGSSGGTTSVTVQPGDTLRGIAARFGCSFEDIARQNGIPNPDLIYPGQVLQVPHSTAGGSNGLGNFGASARNVRLVDGGRRLEGELLRDGRWVGSSLMLDERIENSNGTLRFV
ncbi:hypothetical protein VTK26DRAFT_4193 [Humicola hyalothermophila]